MPHVRDITQQYQPWSRVRGRWHAGIGHASETTLPHCFLEASSHWFGEGGDNMFPNVVPNRVRRTKTAVNVIRDVDQNPRLPVAETVHQDWPSYPQDTIGISGDREFSIDHLKAPKPRP